MPKKKRWGPGAFHLDETERGNIWLIDPENPGRQQVYIRLDGIDWIEISTRPENYPGLKVQTITVTDQKLARHIMDKFEGWEALKLNLEFPVPVDGSNIILSL